MKMSEAMPTFAREYAARRGAADAGIADEVDTGREVIASSPWSQSRI
jgi:hypothetical protein